MSVLSYQSSKKVAPHMSFAKRMIFATTMINAGIKENVLPVSASAIINFRILPGDTAKSVKEYVIKIINNPLIKVTETRTGREASKVSNPDAESFKLLTQTIHQANGTGKTIIIAPYLAMVGTDSRNFEDLSDNIYRFLFNYAGQDDVKRIHSINERISIDNYVKVIRFYFQLIKNSDSLPD